MIKYRVCIPVEVRAPHVGLDEYRMELDVYADDAGQAVQKVYEAFQKLLPSYTSYDGFEDDSVMSKSTNNSLEEKFSIVRGALLSFADWTNQFEEGSPVCGIGVVRAQFEQALRMSDNQYPEPLYTKAFVDELKETIATITHELETVSEQRDKAVNLAKNLRNIPAKCPHGVCLDDGSPSAERHRERCLFELQDELNSLKLNNVSLKKERDIAKAEAEIRISQANVATNIIAETRKILGTTNDYLPDSVSDLMKALSFERERNIERSRQ